MSVWIKRFFKRCTPAAFCRNAFIYKVLQIDTAKLTKNDKSAPDGFFKKKIAALWAILKEKDPPGRLALGMALGIFIGMLPIMGIQMAVVTIVAFPFKANLKAAVLGVWISNPVTFIPLYWANYQFGLLFFHKREVSMEQFSSIISGASEWNWTSIKQSFFNLVDLGSDIMIPLWGGSAILAVGLGILTYIVTYRWVIYYRNRKNA